MRRLVESSQARLARQILGQNFIRPEEVEQRTGMRYRQDEIILLLTEIPNHKFLNYFQQHGYALVAGPPISICLFDFKRRHSALFCHPNNHFYHDERFASSEKVSPGWLAIKTAPLGQSLDKDFPGQMGLLNNDQRLKNAAQMAWLMTIYWLIRGVRLFEDVSIRTSSIDSKGQRICIGEFQSHILTSRHGDQDEDPKLGLAPALDLSFL